MSLKLGQKCHPILLLLTLAILALLPLFGFTKTPLATNCDSYVEDKFDYTLHLQGYLHKLYEEKVLSKDDLLLLIESIRSENKIFNLVAQKAKTESKFHAYSEIFQGYFEQSEQIDLQKVAQWIQDFLQREENVQTKKQQTTTETIYPERPMRFYPIQGQSYTPKIPSRWTQFWNKVRRIKPPGPPVIQHSFEMMDTLVTQFMWAEVFGEAPLTTAVALKDKPKDIQLLNLNIKGKNTQIWPSLPVCSFTWWAAIEFANRLSIQHGLPPVYDTSAIAYEAKNSFASGQLMPIYLLRKDMDLIIKKVKINAPDGDIYKAEGYRLPTVEELSYVARLRDTRRLNEPSEENKNILLQLLHEWGDRFQFYKIWIPVDRFKPDAIDGNKFYDLLTGMDEWTSEKQILNKGVPAYEYDSYFYENPDNFQGHLVGFRLVRSLPR